MLNQYFKSFVATDGSNLPGQAPWATRCVPKMHVRIKASAWVPRFQTLIVAPLSQGPRLSVIDILVF